MDSSTQEEDVSTLPGAHSSHPPGVKCQVPGCSADLSTLKPYFNRNKICEYHCRLDCMLINGTKHRFCQQCGRFQDLQDFQGENRTCFERLQKHNERRRRSRRLRATAKLLSQIQAPSAQLGTTYASSASILSLPSANTLDLYRHVPAPTATNEVYIEPSKSACQITEPATAVPPHYSHHVNIQVTTEHNNASSEHTKEDTIAPHRGHPPTWSGHLRHTVNSTSFSSSATMPLATSTNLTPAAGSSSKPNIPLYHPVPPASGSENSFRYSAESDLPRSTIVRITSLPGLPDSQLSLRVDTASSRSSIGTLRPPKPRVTVGLPCRPPSQPLQVQHAPGEVFHETQYHQHESCPTGGDSNPAEPPTKRPRDGQYTHTYTKMPGDPHAGIPPGPRNPHTSPHPCRPDTPEKPNNHHQHPSDRLLHPHPTEHPKTLKYERDSQHPPNPNLSPPPESQLYPHHSNQQEQQQQRPQLSALPGKLHIQHHVPHSLPAMRSDPPSSPHHRQHAPRQRDPRQSTPSGDSSCHQLSSLSLPPNSPLPRHHSHHSYHQHSAHQFTPHQSDPSEKPSPHPHQSAHQFSPCQSDPSVKPSLHPQPHQVAHQFILRRSHPPVKPSHHQQQSHDQLSPWQSDPAVKLSFHRQLPPHQSDPPVKPSFLRPQSPHQLLSHLSDPPLDPSSLRPQSPHQLPLHQSDPVKLSFRHSWSPHQLSSRKSDPPLKLSFHRLQSPNQSDPPLNPSFLSPQSPHQLLSHLSDPPFDPSFPRPRSPHQLPSHQTDPPVKPSYHHLPSPRHLASHPHAPTYSAPSTEPPYARHPHHQLPLQETAIPHKPSSLPRKYIMQHPMYTHAPPAANEQYIVLAADQLHQHTLQDGHVITIPAGQTLARAVVRDPAMHAHMQPLFTRVLVTPDGTSTPLNPPSHQYPLYTMAAARQPAEPQHHEYAVHPHHVTVAHGAHEQRSVVVKQTPMCDSYGYEGGAQTVLLVPPRVMMVAMQGREQAVPEYG